MLDPGEPVSDVAVLTPSAEPPIRGERGLALAHAAITRVDSAVARALPAELNPLVQLGAMANFCFMVAVATGIALLVWYVPSVYQAYDSMHAMDQAPWTSGLIRSLHRYSSDACMLLVLVHALKIGFARRFTGARWLAWVTGVLLLGLLWLVGWLGYWLVWDQRAQQIAVGTARMLDALPVFVDPLSRSFLTDDTINSLLFFVVFFAHMLVPLVMAIGLWLHIARLARARFFTGRAMSLWICGSLLAVSLLAPAQTAERAQMAVAPQGFTIDAWYLAPLVLTDRLGGGALWALLLISGIALFAVPWWMPRRRIRPASVVQDRCQSCTRCAQDCPYGAISMIPRTDDKEYEAQAHVDPALCVGCGICSASCDSAGVGIEDWFSVIEQRRRLDGWMERATGDPVAFVCTHSAGGSLTVDAGTGRCAELPGYLVMPVPCSGWIHALTVERAQRRGASRVLIVACEPGDCRYREGATWVHERLEGRRSPALRLDRSDPDRIEILHLGPSEKPRLIRDAAAVAAGRRVAMSSTPHRRRWVAAAVLIILSTVTVLGSDLAYPSPPAAEPELVVSFKHPGEISESARVLTDEEKNALPVHMRRDSVIERRRHPVRLRVTIDGREVLLRSYQPRGLWSDGASVAIQRIPVSPGEHRILVEIGDTADPAEWPHQTEATLRFEPSRRQVVLFDRVQGFHIP